MLCITPSTPLVLTQLIITVILRGRYHPYPCFPDKETEAKEISNLPKATQLVRMEPGFKLKQFESRVHS